MMVEIIEFERLVRTLNLLKPLNYFLINYFKLGFFITNGRPTNHRTLLKIFLNPYLRLFGYTIASDVNFTNMDTYLRINTVTYKIIKSKSGKKWIPDFKAKKLKYDFWEKVNDTKPRYIRIVKDKIYNDYI